MGIIIKTKNTSFKSLGMGFIPPVSEGLLSLNLIGDDITSSLKNRANSGVGNAVAINTAGANFGDGYGNKFTFDLNYALPSPGILGYSIILFANTVKGGAYQTGYSIDIISGTPYLSNPLIYASAHLTVESQSQTLPYYIQSISPYYNGDQSAAGSSFGQRVFINTSDPGSVNRFNMMYSIYDPTTKKNITGFGNSVIGLTTVEQVMPDGALFDERNNGNLKYTYDINKQPDFKAGAIFVYKRPLSAEEIQKIYVWAKNYFSKRGLVGL